LVEFAPRDTRSTAKIQGQEVKGQGHSVTQHMSIKKSLLVTGE